MNINIVVQEINLIKNDYKISFLDLLQGISIVESIESLIPILQIEVTNDNSSLIKLGLIDNDIIEITFKDPIENLVITETYFIRDFIISSHPDDATILDDKTNTLILECIPIYFKQFFKTNIYDNFEESNISDMITNIFPKVKINTSIVNYEESINKINYHSSGKINRFFERLSDRAVSMTASPYITLLKHNFYIENKIITLKSIGQIFLDNLAKARFLYFPSPNENFNQSILSNKLNFLIRSSRRNDILKENNLYQNQLKNVECQNFNIFTGKVNSNEIDIKDSLPTIMNDIIPDEENIDNIKFIRDSDLNNTATTNENYFNQKLIFEGIMSNSFIFEINSTLNLHVGDILKINERLVQDKNIFRNYLMITEVSHLINREVSITAIKVIPIDPILYTFKNISNLIPDDIKIIIS